MQHPPFAVGSLWLALPPPWMPVLGETCCSLHLTLAALLSSRHESLRLLLLRCCAVSHSCVMCRPYTSHRLPNHASRSPQRSHVRKHGMKAPPRA